MEWDHITDDWAAMTRRLGKGGLHAPDIIMAPQDQGGPLPEMGQATATAAAAQAVVAVARRLARK